jgi:hypothetical protein
MSGGLGSFRGSLLGGPYLPRARCSTPSSLPATEFWILASNCILTLMFSYTHGSTFLHTTDFSHIRNTLDTSVLHLAGYLVLAHVTCPPLTQVWRRDCSCFSGLKCRVFSELRVWRVYVTQLDSGSYVLTQRWILFFCTTNMSSTRLAFSTSATHHGVGAVKPLRCLSRYCSGLSRKGWFMYVVCCSRLLPGFAWIPREAASKKHVKDRAVSGRA